MTDIERLEKFQKLKDMINGPEADEFKNYWDGRFFTGDMTFVFDKTPYNMYFYQGTMIDVQIGMPANGYYVGICGTQEQWEAFFAHRNFSWRFRSNTVSIPSSSWVALWRIVRITPLWLR